MNFTAQRYKLQARPEFYRRNGTLCNPQRRLKKQASTLLKMLDQVEDGRQDQGKRHTLKSILWLVFCGLTVGNKNLAECLEWAQVKRNKKFLTRRADFPHGLPHATTISRALQVCDLESLVKVLTVWYRCVFRDPLVGQAASMDGKTMKGVCGKGTVSHIFSLVTHQTQRVLGQVGIKAKENEITACPRLLAQAEIDLPGMIITADALLTQKKVVKEIISKGADYLLTVKNNQLFLKQIITAGFTDPALKKQLYRNRDYTHGRKVEITVEISQDFDLEDLRKDWQDLAWLGKITRQGKRPTKVKTKTGLRTKMKPFSEEAYFISSVGELTAKQAFKIIRGHWRIENNLHWQKDWTYLEDRQRLRKGRAPQVMTLLKSLCIALFHQLGLDKISQALRSFLLKPREHRAFLKKAWVIA